MIDNAGPLAPMTVGFLINTCEPFYRGGYERRAWSFARELVRQGHEVRIFTSCPEDQRIDGVQFVRLAAPRRYFNRRGVRNGWADLLFAFGVLKLAWKLKRGSLDVLDVCATPFLHVPPAALIARLKRIPMVLTCHEALLASLPDYVRERGHRGGIGSRIIATVLAGIYRFGMALCSRRIAVSRRTAEALEAEGFPSQAVVEFGLETEAFRSSSPEAQPEPVRFIFCGRLTPIKSVDRTLEALLLLRGEGAPFHFDIIGEGSEAGRLKSMVEVGGAKSVITLHGELDETDKRDLLSRSEVFVLGSPREGFSIATLEAMAQGCCAIVVNDPAHPNGALDFMRDGEEGICVSPGVELMRGALRRLLDDPELRLRLRRGAWEAVGHYRVEIQVVRLVEYYR